MLWSEQGLTGRPCSLVSISAKLSTSLARALAKLMTASFRAPIGTLDHVVNTLLAALTARSTSSWLETGVGGLSSRVEGLTHCRV